MRSEFPSFRGVAKLKILTGCHIMKEETIIFGESTLRRNFIPNLPYNPILKDNAKALRKAGVLSEVLFWQRVHRKKFYNLDFDRQRVIGNYIVDFHVKSLGLIIEIDGNSHQFKETEDVIRQNYLESLGIVFFRVSDLDVKRNLDAVMQNLEDFIIHEFAIKQ